MLVKSVVFVFLLLIGLLTYSVNALAIPVQTTFNVHVDSANLYNNSTVDLSSLLDQDFTFIFTYEEYGDFWAGGPTDFQGGESSTDSIEVHSTPSWSTDFNLPAVSGGYLQDTQPVGSTYDRVLDSYMHIYLWSIADPMIGSVSFLVDDIGTIYGRWSGHPSGGNPGAEIIFTNNIEMTTSIVTPVPESASLVLMIIGMGGVVMARNKARINAV